MDLEKKRGSNQSQALLARIRRGWVRDSQLGVARRVHKGVQFLEQLFWGRIALRTCTTVGANPRVAGRLHVVNQGSIVVGERININSTWLSTELVSGREGRIEIGNDVLINFGTVIAAADNVVIGDRCLIGPHCIISDVDIPEAATSAAPHRSAKPILIGNDVWLAGRVTIRPGVTIGDGAVVVAGSIVESDIPAQTMASGIPARPLPKFAPARAGAESSAANDSSRSTVRSEGSAAEKEKLGLFGVVISDFTVDEVVRELAVDPSVHVEAMAYLPDLNLQNQQATRQSTTRDFAVVWTSPASAIPLFGRLLEGAIAHEKDLLVEVEKFCALVEQIAASFRYVLVPTWTQPSHLWGQGAFDSRPGGIAWALAVINLRLMSSLGRRANIVVLDANRWQAAAGRSAFNPRAWYLGHMAATRPLTIEAGQEIRSVLNTLFAPPRMLLALARETVFWEGSLDTSGGPAQARSEAYRDYQRTLQTMRRRGVLLGVLGQTESSKLPRTIRPSAGFALKEEEFSVCSPADGDEVTAITALAARLGISLDAVVYVSAQATERERIRAALPAVFVPEWPTDKLLYPSALLGLRCFDGIAALDNRDEATR